MLRMTLNSFILGGRKDYETVRVIVNKLNSIWEHSARTVSHKMVRNFLPSFGGLFKLGRPNNRHFHTGGILSRRSRDMV